MTRKSIRERNAESIARAATPETEPEQPTSSPAAPAAAPGAAGPAPAKATSTTKRATPPAPEPAKPVDVTGWTPDEHDELDEKEAVADQQKATELKRQRQARNALDERVNLGIYLTADTYAAMKSAYLADWSNGGEADTLYKWVADALAAHAARTPAKRAGYASTGPARAEHRTGNTRAFKIPGDVYQRMQDALAADEAAQRWTSESAWSVEALTAAIEAARAANGGTLPDPPARLPNRLKRRGR